jgi:hypothetical protein
MARNQFSENFNACFLETPQWGSNLKKTLLDFAFAKSPMSSLIFFLADSLCSMM